jgi:hypothetical protein
MACAMKVASLIRRSPLYGDETAPRTELWVIRPDSAREIAVRLFDCAALPYTWRVALRDVISARRRRRRASDSVT